MTFEEAKKILEKEGFYVEKVTRPCVLNGWFTKYESPEICEAVHVVCSAGYKVLMFETAFQARKERLKKEYEKNTKAPGPGEEQPKENSLKAATDAFILQANEIMRLKKKNAELLEAIDKMKEGNPALKEAASQFNDALLDELRKKIAAYKKLHFYDTKTLKRKDEIIEELRDKNAELLGMVERMKEDVKDIDTNLNAVNKTNKCLNKKVVELTKIKGDLNSWISGLYFCIHHNNDNYKYKLKRLGKEISKLNGIIHKKNLKIEELRKESSRHLRGKIKMFGENMDLEQMLKDKNAVLSDVAEELRLTKIREKNLAELGLKYVGENEKLKKELADKVVDKIDAQALKSAESALAYKEKVIDKLTKENNDYKKCVEEFRNKIADMTIGKIDIQNIRLKEKDKEIKELNDKAKSVNEHRHKELAEKDEVIAEKDEVIADLNHELKAKHKKYVWYKGAYDAAQQILNTIADYAAKHPDKKFSDQMVGENHPTEDNPEEIEIEEAVKIVRKAMKEGHTVTIDYKD